MTPKPPSRRSTLALALLASAGLHACTTESAATAIGAQGRDSREAEVDPIAPIPTDLEQDPGRVALGQRLFADPALSGDGRVACTTCHLATKALADGQAHAAPPGRTRGQVNVPTLYNVGLAPRLNWSGKFASLEEHHDALMKNPGVMASSWEEAVSHVAGGADYPAAFARVYGAEGVSARTLRDALIAYERSLLTPGSRFDAFVLGDQAALTGAEKAGYALFKSLGCVSCHQGTLVGGNLFEKIGVMRDYFAERGGVEEADFGRFNVTGREEDRFRFRVPSLRNVALTAPYFHDGSRPALENAIQAMGRYQLGRTLSDADTSLLADFLRSLTGKYQGHTLE